MKLGELLPVLDSDKKLILMEQERGSIILTDLCECYKRSSKLKYYKYRDIKKVTIHRNYLGTTSFKITLAK